MISPCTSSQRSSMIPALPMDSNSRTVNRRLRGNHGGRSMFGATLMAVTRGRPSVWSWMDACLVPIAWGIGVKMVAVAINLGLAQLDFTHRVPLGGVHAAVLLTADLVMGTLFVQEARRRGVLAREGVMLWVALNGYFALLLFTLIRIGGVR